MDFFKVAVIGRPNVGKSSLFNRICGKRIAIVEEKEGVTRDRLSADADCFGFPIRLVDTGGIDPYSKMPFQKEIKQQAELALKQADAVIFVVDGSVPPTELDREVASMLLKSKKPLIMAVNKCDTIEESLEMQAYHGMGIPDLFFVSAAHGYNVGDMLQELAKKLRHLPPPVEKKETHPIKLSIVGRTNVGKSTLLNQILGEERTIVSPIPGTTRDAVDSEVNIGSQDYLIIDTAGIRRKNAERDPIDKFATIRTESAIERSDICLLILDAREGVTQIEKRLVNAIEEHAKGCILFLNKWDLVKGFRMEHCISEIHRECPFLTHCPVIVGSAKTGRNVDAIFPRAKEVYTELKRRITTGQLNRFMEKAIQKYHPPMIGGKRLRIYYLTQTSTNPPSFILFVNYPELMTETYKKYLLNQFREVYGFMGVPIKIDLKQKAQKEMVFTHADSSNDD